MPAGRLSPGEVADRTKWLRQVTKAALVEGIDFGVIPGTDRPSLLQPGAQVLLRAADLGFSVTRLDDADFDARRSVTYRATTATAPGSRSPSATAPAPTTSPGTTAPLRTPRPSSGPGGLKDRRPPRTGEVPRVQGAVGNTLVKMAQKRALVGAAL